MIFSNVATDGEGNISVSVNDLSNGSSPAAGRNIGLSELTLTAVPEPSVFALLAGSLALVSVMMRRRQS